MKAMLKKAVKEQQHSIGKIIFGFSFVFVSKHDILGGNATGNWPIQRLIPNPSLRSNSVTRQVAF